MILLHWLLLAWSCLAAEVNLGKVERLTIFGINFTLITIVHLFSDCGANQRAGTL